jgi:hypothetical protein
MRLHARWTIAAAAAILVSCEGAYLTAPPDSFIDLNANPPFVAAHGGTSEITAFIIEPNGTYVPDGTVVRWTTDIGRIDPETRTRRGVATARFVSDSRSGLATITAFSGSVSAQLVGPRALRVGNANVAAIRLRAVPSRITISNSTHVIATVVDGNGNPVANVPVFFEVDDADKATEFFDSAGAPVFTDNNGEAEDVLRTRRNVVGVADVRARAPRGDGTFVVSDALGIPIL